jgi:hypothetical protein
MSTTTRAIVVTAIPSITTTSSGSTEAVWTYSRS